MSQIPWTLYRYISIKALIGIFGLLIILTGLILLIDTIENLREVERIDDAGVRFALMLTFLRAPKIALTVTPFIFLFGTMWAFFELNRKSEIAVMRSAGLSVWGLMAPVGLIAFIIGILIIIVADPVASKMDMQSEIAKNEIRGKSARLLKQLQGDIWLRQRDGDTALILHAEEYNEAENILTDVTLWKRTLEGVFIERWDADTATIGNKQFILQDARRRQSEGSDKIIRETQIVPSAFDLTDLRDEITRPDTMSIWALPDFIELAEDAGLPTVKYQLRYHDLLSLPLKLLAMVFIAATFSLRPVRSGGTLMLIIAGVGAGFMLYIISEFSSAIAEARVIPVLIAAWTPAFLAVFLALSVLMTTEDG